jgi:hypothetical protein
MEAFEIVKTSNIYILIKMYACFTIESVKHYVGVYTRKICNEFMWCNIRRYVSGIEIKKKDISLSKLHLHDKCIFIAVYAAMLFEDDLLSPQFV